MTDSHTSPAVHSICGMSEESPTRVHRHPDSTSQRRDPLVGGALPHRGNHSNQPGESAGLTIRISAGTGTGRTTLSAFDAALRGAGVSDFNLIRLSSVIPPGSRVVQVEASHQLSGTHGDALCCVYAEAFASTPLEEAWAGVSWSWRDDGSGEGLFVEHSGSSETAVESDLVLSMADLCLARGGGFIHGGSLMTSAECVDRPVCAIVVATYRNWGWNTHAY